MSQDVLPRANSELAEFGAEWIAAWNAHDLGRILDLYEQDFEFSSPVLRKRIPESKGRLHGWDEARMYWSAAFEPSVNLHFEHIATLVGISSVVVHYKGLRGKLCTEFFEFSAAGKVTRSHAHETESDVS